MPLAPDDVTAAPATVAAGCGSASSRILNDCGIKLSGNESGALAAAVGGGEGDWCILEDGRLPIHNNMSELQLRRETVGRKNWLFVGSDDAGAVNAHFTSLLASCQLFAIEPWSYLRDVLCLLPQWPEHALLDLAPLHWNKTKARDEVRALLNANLFRKLTLRG